jgi:hypothetical protein
VLKATLAVIAGYLVLAIVMFIAFTGLYLAIGADGAFQPGTYYVSTLWIGASIAVNVLAAAAGGWVCAAISRGAAAKVLAGLVLLLGIAFAIPVLDSTKDPRPVAREADTPNLVAMTNARQPVWLALALPVVGAVGVLTGASKARRD